VVYPDSAVEGKGYLGDGHYLLPLEVGLVGRGLVGGSGAVRGGGCFPVAGPDAVHDLSVHAVQRGVPDWKWLGLWVVGPEEGELAGGVSRAEAVVAEVPPVFDIVSNSGCGLDCQFISA